MAVGVLKGLGDGGKAILRQYESNINSLKHEAWDLHGARSKELPVLRERRAYVLSFSNYKVAVHVRV